MASAESTDSSSSSTNDEEVLTKWKDPRGYLIVLIRNIFATMSLYGKECCLSLAVIFTVYAALQTSPLKTKVTSSPKPFFPKHSPVADFYWGNVQQVFDRMQDSDISFVFYYAPWDASSMDVRWEFEKTATYYGNQVYFAAVNCWWPDGECRRQFPKIQSFPILIVYRSNGRGIQFRGPYSMPYMVLFLHNVIHPLAVLHSRLDLLKQFSKHNVVVVGFFNFHESPQPPGYLSFYMTALRALEKDTAREVSFAVISNVHDARKFVINVTGTIHMHLWTSVQAFNSTSNGFSSQKLLKWIFERKQELVQRLAPPGVKSHMLSKVVEKSPTIVMMTPRFVSTLLLESPFYYLFKEVALDYLNCNSSMQMNKIIQLIRSEQNKQKLELLSVYEDQTKNCGGIFVERCCFTVIARRASLSWTSTNVVCELCTEAACREQSMCDISMMHSVNVPRTLRIGCASVSSNPFQRLSVCCFARDVLISQYVSRAIEHSAGWSADDRGKCLLSCHPHVVRNVQLHRENAPIRMNFSGLGCTTNKTLAFVVLDASNYEIFFSRLGVDVSRAPSSTAVAIIDIDQESLYVLQKQVTRNSLREFISNFTLGLIERHRRFSSPTEQQWPRVPLERQTESIHIVEVTSSNFRTLMAKDKDVVLLMYTSWCAFCSGIAHIFLTAARYFHAVNEEVVFARQHNSVEFPDDQPITATALIHFVLANSKLDVKLRTVLSLCSASCITHNRKLALQKIHKLLSRYRTLDGRYKGAVSVLREACPNEAAKLEWYTTYATHIVHEMCIVLLQLGHSRTLELVLSTTSGDRLTADQLRMLVGSHEHFRERVARRECRSLGAKLKTTLNSCSTKAIRR